MKKTPWFVGVKPARPGPYEVPGDEYIPNYYSYFDGKKFNGCWDSPDAAVAALSHRGERFWTPVRRWRGLTKEAK